MKKCYLCGSNRYRIIHNGVRGNKDIDVYKCENCGLVYLSRFVTEEEGFYENSGMWKSDGLDGDIRLARVEAERDDDRREKTTRNYIENKDVLDFGCGAGGYLSKIKPYAKSVVGIELENNKRIQLEKEGLRCLPSVLHLQNEQFDVITAFHVLEHLEDPISILMTLREHLSDDGRMIIEVPNANDALLSLYRSDSFSDFTYWVCHLYLFDNNTLSEIIRRAGFRIAFIQQIQRYPLSNHLYWLANERPGGHFGWAAINDPELDAAYEKKLAQLGIADTIMAVIEKET